MSGDTSQGASSRSAARGVGAHVARCVAARVGRGARREALGAARGALGVGGGRVLGELVALVDRAGARVERVTPLDDLLAHGLAGGGRGVVGARAEHRDQRDQ